MDSGGPGRGAGWLGLRWLRAQATELGGDGNAPGIHP
jgi:hypothetical protein